MAITEVRIAAAENGFIVGNEERDEQLRPKLVTYIFKDFSDVVSFLTEKNGGRVKLSAVLNPV